MKLVRDSTKGRSFTKTRALNQTVDVCTVYCIIVFFVEILAGV